jgi:RNA polymerase sigma-70 factor (ECF subfamily)
LSAVENVPQSAQSQSNDRLLIEAAQHDPARFAELYEQNFDRVYAYIARRVRDRDRAEELTAEVFHQALSNLGRFEWRGVPFAAWLLRMAANAVHDWWKANARESELPEEDLPEAGAERAVERQALLAKLVETLPEDQKLVIVRRFIDQRSIREIATELQRSEGAVKQLQFRALQSLKERASKRETGSNHG